MDAMTPDTLGRARSSIHEAGHLVCSILYGGRAHAGQLDPPRAIMYPPPGPDVLEHHWRLHTALAGIVAVEVFLGEPATIAAIRGDDRDHVIQAVRGLIGDDGQHADLIEAAFCMLRTLFRVPAIALRVSATAVALLQAGQLQAAQILAAIARADAHAPALAATGRTSDSTD